MRLDDVRRIRSIKQVRRDRAETARREASARFDQALAALVQANAALQEWREERPRREQALYDGVLGREVEQRELDEVRHAVLALRDHERTLDKTRVERETVVAEARKALDAAVVAAAAAQRNLDGFDDLVAVLSARERAEQERREDLELEEFARARDNEQDDEVSHDESSLD